LPAQKHKRQILAQRRPVASGDPAMSSIERGRTLENREARDDDGSIEARESPASRPRAAAARTRSRASMLQDVARAFQARGGGLKGRPP